ncbi:MAG: PQQ-binding-like beta-propeller repeat protein [Planctomycetaceae bacterium]|nr:PQQ-binding-like beta-propeller repeat protein [Planctomycetaceae bacterium]
MNSVRTTTALFSGLLLSLTWAAHRASAEDGSQDWPMWRGNAARTAAVNNELPGEMTVQWVRRQAARKQAWDDPLNLDLMTYDRVFEPIVYAGLLCVGYNDQDKLEAVDVETGRVVWTYFTEGPVRLPPVGHDGRIYFGSDDGFLYCVNAADGQLQWKFRGAPNSQKALGNSRLISAWPSRGGPVVYDGDVYFAASIWPFMGTFIYSLDAKTGDVNWVNDSTGAQYIKQPHSAPSFAGVAPQGAFVATDEFLIVPGGRSVPAVFDRRTGELKYFEINAGGKGTGGSFVTADERHYYVHTREKGTRAFDLTSGKKTAFTPNEPVIAGGVLYSAEQDGDRSVIRAFDVTNEDKTARKPLWEVEAAGQDELILAGSTLVAASGRTLSLISTDASPQVRQTLDVDALQTDESIARVLVAARRMIVVGDAGSIVCVGEPKNIPALTETTAPTAKLTQQQIKVAKRVLSRGQAEGYAFWFGRADDPALAAMIELSPFVQLAVVDDSAARIDALRKSLNSRGLLGKITGHVGTPQTFRAPRYVAHVVMTTPEVAAQDDAVAAMWPSVRPYGGVLTVVNAAADAPNIAGQLTELQLEQAVVTFGSGDPDVSLMRAGALPGSSDWTHQYGDIANTVKSDDSRVKLPLGILWFGGSSNMDVLPRHGHGPPEQVVGGRLVIQGMNSLSCRDVYTGRVLWKREFEDLGTYDVYYDATYENTPLNPKYNQVHIPGANGRGTNYVVTEDCVYLLIGASCLMLDPATGRDIGKVEMPIADDGSQPEWGYLGVYGDVLLGGVGFANYRQRHDLQFEADKKLKGNRLGFGSKSFDRAASAGLIGFDRRTGKQLWRHNANHSFWHNGIVAGGDRIYCLDKNPTQVEQAMRRRGLALPDSYRIVCLDATTGAPVWEVHEGVFGTWLGYSEEHDLLLQAGAAASDRLYAEVGQGMRVYKAASGEIHWKKDSLKYAGPCILHNDLIITNANSYAESAGAFSLIDGSQHMVPHPLTGEMVPWKMTRAYGCNNIIASENMLTFRSGAAGYYDLTTNSGTGNLGGFKSGCTSNLVVANGVLNAPDYTRTCSCSYQNQTSLALVHMPGMEFWSVNSLASAEAPNPAEAPVAVTSVGFNLGAAGDRRDKDGVLWLEYPARAGASPPFEVQMNAEARPYSQHAASRAEDPRSWITSSGVDHLTELTIRLQLTKQIDLADGIRISHPSDDAEESSDGSVGLGSSDLELTEDDGPQTVGLRFQTVPLPQAALGEIRGAWLQFTCDEPSSDPTSLWIAGELSTDAARFSTASHDVSSRTLTRTQVTWDPPAWNKTGDADAAQRTPDLSAIVREIIQQPGWKADQPMVFVIGGDGRRTAVSSRGGNKEATRLVIDADLPGENPAQEQTLQPWDVELVFAAPRGETQDRVFDIQVGERVVATNVTITPDPARARVIRLSGVGLGKSLSLKFVPRQGWPLLSGLRLRRSTD